MKDKQLKRVNVLIRNDQWEAIQEKGLNLSGLIRDLLDDRLSERTVVLSVSQEARGIYNTVISNFGASDADLEKFFLHALDALLAEKTREIETARGLIKSRGPYAR